MRANAETHNLWAFRAFINRLARTAEEFGITVEVRPEAWTSRECQQCGSTDRTTRHQDTFTCEYGFEGHGPCDSSGTTTTGRGNHTLTTVLKKRAQTRVSNERRRRTLPPWGVGMSRNPQREESLPLQSGEDVRAIHRGNPAAIPE